MQFELDLLILQFLPLAPHLQFRLLRVAVLPATFRQLALDVLKLQVHRRLGFCSRLLHELLTFGGQALIHLFIQGVSRGFERSLAIP